jgi:hypothetical protein
VNSDGFFFHGERLLMRRQKKQGKVYTLWRTLTATRVGYLESALLIEQREE